MITKEIMSISRVVTKETIINNILTNILEMFPIETIDINIQLYGDGSHSIHNYTEINREIFL